MNSLTTYPYPGSRRVILGQRGAVATSQPLATLAGMEMLQAGGNAVDAAIATAIALTVVEPTSNGIGSDAFALVWDGQLHALNASGKSPNSLTLDQFAGFKAIPKLGWYSVTVPGAVSAWRSLWERWGKLPFEQLFAPAIRWAESGFPVSPVTALAWQRAASTYLSLPGSAFEPFRHLFFPQGRSPEAGEIWRSQPHADTLRAIATTGGDSFYRGHLAQQIADFAAATGGWLTVEDLATHQAEWVTPIATDYRGFTVWEVPPNTQGIATLLALNILEGFELTRYPRESAESYHLQLEAMKLAFADTYRYVADSRSLEFPVASLLDKQYAASRRQLVGDRAASVISPGLPQGGTVYLATADADLMVSFIQSNYAGFGCGIVPANTGIALQNRGYGFTLESGHPNQFAPGKRPFHTIIPGFISQDGQPLGPFGVMGGPMQPQGHLQVAVNLIDYDLNPQAGLDAPRWQWFSENRVSLESGVSSEIVSTLSAWGHKIWGQPDDFFGRGQIIWRRKNGVLVAASDSRADGLALAW